MSTATSLDPGGATAATYRVSEIFLSLQGEGPSAGARAHFVRLQGCDVGCGWCDTKYSWDAAGGVALSFEDVWREARGLGEAPMLVVTGGEPLAHAGVEALLEEALERWERVEVETSGIAAPPLSHPRLFYNLSPKLPSVTPRWADCWRHLSAWLAEPRATLKLVIADAADLDDAQRLIGEHRIPAERIMLMPEGMTAERLRPRSEWLAEVCRREGYRLSPRLHVELWGARRGV